MSLHSVGQPFKKKKIQSSFVHIQKWLLCINTHGYMYFPVKYWKYLI